MIGRFPKDAPKRRVVKALQKLGFRLIREREHIAMERQNPDGTKTPLTMPIIRELRDRLCVRSAHRLEFNAAIS